ncbi:MAG: ABC transporter permease [Propionibacteriaceae bacterium]|jgi:teichoic acid transport system permease protein|nr:ABC transporter permease [Propionibacteriaceae bacterium]
MVRTARIILRDNWAWRGRIWHLAFTELQKEVRGSVLSWVWLLVTPAVYIGGFWFALSIGMRTASPVAGVPYIVWISVGIVPWFFISSLLTGGANVYRRYSYLVNRLRFPLSVISSFFGLAQLIVFAASMLLVLALTLAMGVKLTLPAVQVPVIALLMYAFWVTWSVFTAPLAAISKDIYNLIKALSILVFWFSGTIFDVSHITIRWIRWLLAFNPITFFVTAFREAICRGVWLWDDPRLLWPFAVVFALLILLALKAQDRLSAEVPDVL